MNESAPWPSTRPSLFVQLRDDPDGEAWNMIASLYGPLVYRYCRTRSVQDADAADITQNVILKIRHFEYQPDKGHFRDWLRTVTRNEIHRAWSRNKRPGRGAGGEPAQPFDALDAAADDPNWDRFFDAHVLEAALERVRKEFTKLEWEVFEAVAFRVVDGPDGKCVEWVRDPDPAHVAQRVEKNVAWVHKVKWKVQQSLKQTVVYLAEDLGVLV